MFETRNAALPHVEAQHHLFSQRLCYCLVAPVAVSVTVDESLTEILLIESAITEARVVVLITITECIVIRIVVSPTTAAVVATGLHAFVVARVEGRLTKLVTAAVIRITAVVVTAIVIATVVAVAVAV